MFKPFRPFFILLILVLSASAQAVVEQAKPSDSFVDSIGVNTHFNNGVFPGHPYGQASTIQKLVDLGIRHVRDNSDNTQAFNTVDAIYNNYNIKTNLILGSTSVSPTDLATLLAQHPAFESIEGLNEPDAFPRSYQSFSDNPGANSYPATKAFQNDLYAAVKANPNSANRLVLSPAMANSANAQYLNPINFDVAAMHSYPVAHSPTFGLDTKITQTNAMNTGAKPIVSTETGYYNHPHTGGEASETSVGKYMPRLFAEYFNRNITRTYSYELIDQANDPNNIEANFGLLHADGSEKPAYTALKNLIDLTKEPAAPIFPTTTLNYNLTFPTGAKIDHTLLQKSDGTTYLLLWNEVASWSLTNSTDINNAPIAVTLGINQSFLRARLYEPNVSGSPFATYLNPSSLNLNVNDRIMVVELSNVPEPTFLLPLALLALLPRRRHLLCRGDACVAARRSRQLKANNP
jgi:hypothetical protein